MNLIDTSFNSASFKLEIKHSLLFEAALGIAVITYPKLHDKLSQPATYWQFLRNRVSDSLEAELQICQQQNTWKMLLQLLHVRDFTSVDEFTTYIEQLDDEDFLFTVLPYLDQAQQKNRQLAATGDQQAINDMVLACKDHLFFPQMITYISQTPAADIKTHLIHLMNGWFDEIVKSDLESRGRILERDFFEKKELSDRLTTEEIVEWATGIEHRPEPNIAKVILIPHYIYRPWTIQANMEGTKIYYYPVSEKSIFEENDLTPQLVQLYKALGDEKRLKIVRLLFEKDCSLKELTEQLGIGKTTVHHHLALLRSAHIVKVKESFYSLNLTSLKMQENQLWSYLERAGIVGA